MSSSADGHARLGRALGAPDAGQLGGRLHAPALVDGGPSTSMAMPSARRRSATATGRSGGTTALVDPPLPQRPDRRLELRLVGRHALARRDRRTRAPPAEPPRRPGAPSRYAQPRASSSSPAAPVARHEQQRIHDLERHLVPQRGISDRVAVQQDRRHGRERLRLAPPRARSAARVSSAGLARSLFSSTNWLAVKIAPCGSATTVIRTHGASIGGTITLPPSSGAFLAIASASSTANVTPQCAGVSGWSSGIGTMLATTSSKPSGAPTSATLLRRPGLSRSR